MSGAQEHMVAELEFVDYFHTTHQVRAKCDVKKGGLKLFPLTEMRNIAWKSIASPFMVTKSAKPVAWLERPSMYSGANAGNWKGSIVVAGFWYVELSQDDTAVNMKLVKVNISGYMFPMMENMKAIKKHDKLVLKDPRAEKAIVEPVKKKSRT
jgi:hypothetical protein